MNRPSDRRTLVRYKGGDVLCYVRDGGKHYISVTPSGLDGEVRTRKTYPIPESVRVEIGRALLEQDWDPNAPVEVAPDQSDGTVRCSDQEERDTDVDIQVPIAEPHRTSG